MIAILVGLHLLTATSPAWQLQPPMASLALATNPSDGQFVLYNIQGQIVQQGKTPFVGLVPPGRYRLVLTKVGYFQEQRSLTLQPNQQQILQIELFPQTSTSPLPATGNNSTQPTPPTPAPTSRPVATGTVTPNPPSPATTPGTPTTTGQSVPSATTPGTPGTSAPHVAPQTRVAPGTPASPNQPPAARNVTQVKEKPKTTVRRIPWLPLAAAGGLAVAGGIFWGLSGGALDASKDANRTQIEAYNEYSQARSHRSTAVFLFAGGGVALGLAALFYFWPPSSDNSAKKKSPHSHDVPILGFTLQAQ